MSDRTAAPAPSRIGAVAATDDADGVVSPSGVGYDISCGVRLLVLGLGRTSSASTSGP